MKSIETDVRVSVHLLGGVITMCGDILEILNLLGYDSLPLVAILIIRAFD